jgi:hypothetical protein
VLQRQAFVHECMLLYVDGRCDIDPVALRLVLQLSLSCFPP